MAPAALPRPGVERAPACPTDPVPLLIPDAPACRLSVMGSTFQTRALLLPAHLSGCAAALALTCGGIASVCSTPGASGGGGGGGRSAEASLGPPRVPVHWLLPGDDPGLAALALAEALSQLAAATSDSATAIETQRLAEICAPGQLQGAATMLPGLAGAWDPTVPHALRAASGSLAGLVAATGG